MTSFSDIMPLWRGPVYSGYARHLLFY